MPKSDIDYYNTIIYKITCTDPNIKHIYVGHTTNFVQRKYSHKQTCNNIKSPYYNFKLYKTIRENGNWSNWEMVIVNFYNCKDHLEARQKEQEYYISLNANLNSIEPLPVKNTIISIPTQVTSEKQIINNFCCTKCDYKCFSKFNFNRHIATNKHKKKQVEQTGNYSCDCGKIYKYSQGLSKHMKKCIKINSSQKDTNLVIELLKQNKEKEMIIINILKDDVELKSKILDACKNF